MSKETISIDDLMSLADAANLYPELKHSSLRRYAWNGRLKSVKIGRNYLTTKRWIDNYLTSRQKGKRTDLQK